jgi:hypothetical protein
MVISSFAGMYQNIRSEFFERLHSCGIYIDPESLITRWQKVTHRITHRVLIQSVFRDSSVFKRRGWAVAMILFRLPEVLITDPTCQLDL